MRKTILLCSFVLVAAAASLSAQDAAKPDAAKAKPAAPAAEGMPPLPTAGPEHAILKKDVGVWDATVEMMGMGPTPMVSKGTETNTMFASGLWLVSDFKADMMGQPFQGHGTFGWDPSKKKYVGTWVDSMTSGVSLSEGTWDAGTSTMTAWMQSSDMTGATQKMRTVTEYKSADSRIFTMYMPGPDGKEAASMRITYARRK